MSVPLDKVGRQSYFVSINNMSTRKCNAVRRLAATAQYPATFAARLKAVPDLLLRRLTAAEIAMVLDGPMNDSFSAGYWSGQSEA